MHCTNVCPGFNIYSYVRCHHRGRLVKGSPLYYWGIHCEYNFKDFSCFMSMLRFISVKAWHTYLNSSHRHFRKRNSLGKHLKSLWKGENNIREITVYAVYILFKLEFSDCLFFLCINIFISLLKEKQNANNILIFLLRLFQS